jgi:hypothetical protein
MPERPPPTAPGEPNDDARARAERWVRNLLEQGERATSEGPPHQQAAGVRSRQEAQS